MENVELEDLNSKIYNERLWEKYYSYSKKDFCYPKMSIYDYLYQSNIENLDKYSINYLGKKITFGELFSKIDECLYSLYKSGVKENDIVSICMPTTPESVIALYAINKIGAISNFIDVRKSPEEIQYCLNNANSKILLCLDSVIPKINQIVDNTTLNKIIYISALESNSILLKSAFRLKQRINGELLSIKNDSGYTCFKRFIQKNPNYKFENPPKYFENRLAVIEYTSGSTGRPKAVQLSNDTINNRVYQYKNNGMVYNTGDVYMDIIPIFIAFGVVIGVHLPLCMGMEDALIPAYDDKELIKLLKKYNPKHFTLTPASYNYLTSHPKFSTIDFSNKLTLAAGGDGMNANENIRYNKAIRQNNGIINISNGYGGSEIGAPFSTEKNGVYKPGSVGIPLPGNNIIIFKHGTYESAGYNEIGDICMIVDNPMLGYLNNQELTDSVIIKFANNKLGILLGDAGYVDEDGFLFVKGRYENILHSCDGKDVWACDIESIVYKFPFVQTCAISQSATHAEESNLFVVLTDDNKYSNCEIQKMIMEEIKLKLGLSMNININFVSELPKTSSGKIDRKTLRKML